MFKDIKQKIRFHGNSKILYKHSIKADRNSEFVVILLLRITRSLEQM